MSTPQPPGDPEPTRPPAPLLPTATDPAEPERAPSPAQEPAPAPIEDADRPSTWQPLLYLRIVILLLVVAYAIAFVAQNTNRIPVDFVFWTAKVRLIWEILLLLVIGLVGGILLSQLHRHRRRARLAKKAGQSPDSGTHVGRRDKAEGKPR